ncbi:NUDIX domain-containing protein [Algihabitans albus]|uniref:NUDIX domain-containing protein n=1 Tax=Algihabitans albus TaxID=2164067 RepID=UPI000E5D30CF|nr:NUDIX domain-containing protein [Algihabitans albus]
MITFGVIEPGRFYTRRRGAYALILTDTDDLLVINQRGEIILPGGGLDPGETEEQALKREMVEETGHAIDVGAKIGEAREFTYETSYESHFDKICVFFRAVLGRRLAEPIEDDHEMLWMPRAQASERLSKGSQRWAASQAA